MNTKTELSLEPQEGELQPVGKIPTVTAGEVKVITILAKVNTVETLANQAEVAQHISELKAAYEPDIEKIKSNIGEVKTMADFKRADSLRLAVREKRLEFTKTADAAFKQNKALIDNAKIGKSAVEDFLKGIESDLESALSAKENELKAEAARKKAIADALTTLKSSTINSLLTSADIKTAIDDFRIDFGNLNYQESQDAANAIFESKMVEFETIHAAAVAREENEAKVRLEEARNQQRANINVTFPIAEISGYAARSSADIQTRRDWTANVSMSAFELVLDEAESAKQSCLNMLNAFLPMAVDREAKEAADKAKVERVEREKQYLADWDDAIQEKNDRLSWESEIVDSVILESGEIDNNQIIDSKPESDQANYNGNSPVIDMPSHIYGVEVANNAEKISDEPRVFIPVRHLKSLISAAENGMESHGLDNDEQVALEFAKSLI